MRAFSEFVTSRRGKFVVLGIWIVVFAVLMPLGAKLGDETQDDTTSFLPSSAESTEVVKTLDDDFASGETVQTTIVYQRDGGLTDADKRLIVQQAKEIEALPDSKLPLTKGQPPLVPFKENGEPRPGQVSADGSLAYTVLTTQTNYDQEADWGKNIRDLTGDDADGMRILLSGELGFQADSEEVFGNLDTNLLIVTVLLVLVLLGAIYRA